MKTKLTAITFTAFLITGFATAQSFNGASTNLEAQFINSDPVPLQSGESGDIRFKIVNNGDTEAGDVSVQLLDNYPFEVKPDRQTNYSLGEVVPGQEYIISTEVLVADDAPDGSNSFKIRIDSGELQRTVNVPVEVQSNDIELNLANLQTQPGQLMPDTDNNQLMIDIVNNGEKTGENVILNLEAPESFEQTSSFSTRKALGNIQPGERKTASYNLDITENASAGMTSFETVTTYTAGDSTSQVEQTDSFQLSLEGKPQFQVTKNESGLSTGSTGTLRLQVENTGSETSSSTRIRVLDSSDQPFSYDSSSKYIGTLDPGQSGEAVFEVETESTAAIKEYLLDFETRGVKDTETFVEDTTVEVQVENGTQESSGGLPIPVIAAVVILAILGAVVYRRRNEKESEVES